MSKQRGASEFTVILVIIVLALVAGYYFGYRAGRTSVLGVSTQQEVTSNSSAK